MRRRFAILACVALGWISPTARASTIAVGALSYDTFIPAGGGSPGIDAFDIADLTDSFSLPPDFPVSDTLTFLSALLTLTFADSSQQLFHLGDIPPGFLLDGSGNPIVQVPGDQTFVSAEFTATLSSTNFLLTDGTRFQADSGAMDIVLLPSSGPLLAVDMDQVTLTVSGSSVSSTPEPGTWILALLGLLGCALCLRYGI